MPGPEPIVKKQIMREKIVKPIGVRLTPQNLIHQLPVLKTSSNVKNEGHWTDEEHEKFLQGYQKYGRNWTMVAKDFVTTRTRRQVRTHAQKHFAKGGK